MDRDLEGPEGKAFPVVGAAVTDAPPSAGIRDGEPPEDLVAEGS
jgi:hypothetical protein